MKSVVVAASGVLLGLLMCSACGSSNNNYNPNPGSPSPSPAPPSSGGTTIDIVGDRGNQSFTPNPASVAMGSAMSFKNNDGITHRIVANDGSFDTGNIAGGGTSGAVTLSTNGTNYHCTIHPGMIGSINASGGTPPPCTGQYCGTAGGN
jgi:plastocyanin